MKLFPSCFPTDLIYHLDHKLNFNFYGLLFILIPLICIFMCAFYCLTIFFLFIFYNTFKHWLVPFPPIVLFLWNFLSFLFCLFSLLAAAAKSLQSCPTLWDLKDRSPPGSPVPGILQARTLEWVAMSFSSAWKWKVKVKSLSHVWLFATTWTAAYQAPPFMGFSRQEYWSGVPLPVPFLCLFYFKFFLTKKFFLF